MRSGCIGYRMPLRGRWGPAAHPARRPGEGPPPAEMCWILMNSLDFDCSESLWIHRVFEDDDRNPWIIWFSTAHNPYEFIGFDDDDRNAHEFIWRFLICFHMKNRLRTDPGRFPYDKIGFGAIIVFFTYEHIRFWAHFPVAPRRFWVRIRVSEQSGNCHIILYWKC